MSAWPAFCIAAAVGLYAGWKAEDGFAGFITFLATGLVLRAL
jgi:hypothetical protein